jgi:hypothetical protein
MADPKNMTKLVVWPRQKDDEVTSGPYRYTVIGMVITDTPIPGLNRNAVLCYGGDASTPAVVEALVGLSKGSPSPAWIVNSDASNVLCSLHDIHVEDHGESLTIDHND